MLRPHRLLLTVPSWRTALAPSSPVCVFMYVCVSMILCACACACPCARELTCARLTSRARASVCVRVRAGQVAAISGQKKVVHRLVELNADVNARDAQVRSGVAASVMCRKHARDVQECLRACVHTVI